MESEEINSDVTDHGTRKPRSGMGECEVPQVVIERKPQSGRRIMKIGTWNVRSLLKVGKLEELKIIMEKKDIDILGLSETQWKGNDDVNCDSIKVIHSGGEVEGRNGVAIMLKTKWANNIMRTYQVNDRLLMIRIAAKPFHLVIIQVYFPKSEYEDDENEKMYKDIEELFKLTKYKDNVIMMGDFNAIVGSDLNHRAAGKFGLGETNAKGERLLEFCEKHNFKITNTMFTNHKRRLYTWKPSGDSNRYQIDYILVKGKYRYQVNSAKSYPGLVVDSDHVPVVAKCKLLLSEI